MVKIKQKFVTDNQGVMHRICLFCNEIIKYPDGVYFRNGIEVHNKCIAVARMRRGKIRGIDK